MGLFSKLFGSNEREVTHNSDGSVSVRSSFMVDPRSCGRLDSVVVADDPVVPVVQTPHGDVKIRRLVGVTREETEQIGIWSPTGFVEELRRIDPLLLTDLKRSSIFDDPIVAERCAALADAQGSDVPAILADVGWDTDGDVLVLVFADGDAAVRVASAIRRRVGFGKRILLLGPTGDQIGFEPADSSTIETAGKVLYFGGRTDSDLLAALLGEMDAWRGRQEPLRLQIPIG